MWHFVLFIFVIESICILDRVIKIRIEDFGSRTRDEMYRKHRPKVYCRLERSTMGSCFIKPRVYWNLFHPPVEEELCTRGEGLNITMRDPRRICMGTNINVTARAWNISFSSKPQFHDCEERNTLVLPKVDLGIVGFVLWQIQRIKNVPKNTSSGRIQWDAPMQYII